MGFDLHHAARRFGFGQRGSQTGPDDARVWLRAQLDATDPQLRRQEPSIARAAVALRRYKDAARAKAPEPLPPGFADLYRDDMSQLLGFAVSTDIPFRERLVWFWSNHFTVSGRAGNWVFGAAGPYIREAIRPHVTGRLSEMLKAVMIHPGMLIYLDNQLSEGPNSTLGLTQHRGLNENLARECLELHTMGAHGGYTQADVTALASILTGRGVDLESSNPGFVFRSDAHEPGTKQFMGRQFQEGFAGSQAALEFIATHPATYRHIALQLVRQFVADSPPSRCVARVAAVLSETGGDLEEAMLAIIDMPEAWQPLTKFRSPAEYVVAVLRALDLPLGDGRSLYDATIDLGQPFNSPLLPNGWPDTAEAWLSGEALLKRADWAMSQTSRPGTPTVEAVIDATLGNLCSASTRAAVTACPNPAEGLATLFVSPEFLRR